MMRFAHRPAHFRLAFVAVVVVAAAATGTHLLAAREGPDRQGPSSTTRLAQATLPPGAPPKPASSPDTAGPFDQAQKAAIEKIIKGYLLEHPEVMLEVQTALEEKMEKIQAEKMKVALSANSDDIFRDPSAPVAGNPSGDIPVVEFFDYNCGYCKRAFSDISGLVDGDKKVKLILRELPILSKGSEEASRVALAARKQGKYWEMHRALISLKGEANEQSSLRAAEKLGLDMVQLKKDMVSEDVTGEIERVRELARKMGIQGTPHFLVGDRAIAGAPGDLRAQIENHLVELRKSGGCSVC
ncbi:MAG: DsbA family protein [Hyphomicrobiaceae bacterium]